MSHSTNFDEKDYEKISTPYFSGSDLVKDAWLQPGCGTEGYGTRNRDSFFSVTMIFYFFFFSVLF